MLETIRRYLARGVVGAAAVVVAAAASWVIATDDTPLLWRAVWVLVTLFLLLGSVVWVSDNL